MTPNKDHRMAEIVSSNSIIITEAAAEDQGLPAKIQILISISDPSIMIFNIIGKKHFKYKGQNLILFH